MSDDIHFYEPSKGHGLAHDPFNALVGPRPIGWISTVDPQGRRNLAPYSFFNAFCYRPPIVGFASTGWKDSAQNILDTGEFVWNLTTRSLAAAMNASSASVPHGVDEFELAGVTPAPCRIVRPSRVAESPVALECRLTQQIRLTGVDGRPAESWVTFGEVVGVHIDRRYLTDGVYQTFEAHPVLRAGGPGAYAEISPGVRFDLRRPK